MTLPNVTNPHRTSQVSVKGRVGVTKLHYLWPYTHPHQIDIFLFYMWTRTFAHT